MAIGNNFQFCLSNFHPFCCLSVCVFLYFHCSYVPGRSWLLLLLVHSDSVWVLLNRHKSDAFMHNISPPNKYLLRLLFHFDSYNFFSATFLHSMCLAKRFGSLGARWMHSLQPLSLAIRAIFISVRESKHREQAELLEAKHRNGTNAPEENRP